MELNIIKQIRSLRASLRRKPKCGVEAKIIKRELSELRPVLKRREPKPKREVITVNIDGKEMTLVEIAKAYNLEIKTVQARYRVGNRGRLLIRPSQKSYTRST